MRLDKKFIGGRGLWAEADIPRKADRTLDSLKDSDKGSDGTNSPKKVEYKRSILQEFYGEVMRRDY